MAEAGRGGSPKRSQAVPSVAEETSQERPLAVLLIESRIGMTWRAASVRGTVGMVTPGSWYLNIGESWFLFALASSPPGVQVFVPTHFSIQHSPESFDFPRDSTYVCGGICG